MINMIVENKNDTLVMDIPRNFMDMRMKLSSIDIHKHPEEIPVTDKKEEDIRVRLYSDSDIGKHLIRVFSETDTIADVNRTAHKILQADEDIKIELEQNILNDQYDSVQELVTSIDEMIQSAGKHTESFYFPLIGKLDEYEYGDTVDIDNGFMQTYEHDIREAMEEDQKHDMNNMAAYFHGNDSVEEKLVSAVWTVNELDGTLYGCVNVRMKEPFTAEEKESLKNWILGQNSDGFGEGFEQSPVETEDGDLYVSLWHSGDDYFIYDQSEMDEYITLHGQQMGGM